MPLYEYECAACAHRFERIQKFSDPLVDVCPKCGGAVRKLLSSPAIQFKGSGFYITDYARQGKGGGGTDTSASSKSDGGDKGEKADKGEKKEAAKEDKKSESADKKSSSSESKSESKPASGS
jgi:putative FmdB family regulatory protein